MSITIKYYLWKKKYISLLYNLGTFLYFHIFITIKPFQIWYITHERRMGYVPKNEYYTNRNGNDLLYMLKLNKHFILKKSWFLFKTSVFNCTIYLLCFKRDESKYQTTRNSMFQRKKTKHDIEWEKRTIKVMQQLHFYIRLHLYIRFHSAPTIQRRII